MFSVRSAYHVERAANDGPGSSRDTTHKRIWKKIWKLNIPQKVKIISWKIVNNGLPVKDRLSSMGLKVDAICEVFGEEKEPFNVQLEEGKRDVVPFTLTFAMANGDAESKVLVDRQNECC